MQNLGPMISLMFVKSLQIYSMSMWHNLNFICFPKYHLKIHQKIRISIIIKYFLNIPPKDIFGKYTIENGCPENTILGRGQLCEQWLRTLLVAMSDLLPTLN